MPLQLIFLRNVSLLSVGLACWKLCIIHVLCVGFLEQLDGKRSMSRGARRRNALGCRSLNLTSLNLTWEERLAKDWAGLGLNGTGAKRDSLRVQVESCIYLLLFTTKDPRPGKSLLDYGFVFCFFSLRSCALWIGGSVSSEGTGHFQCQ